VECTEDLSPVVLLPAPDASGHELTCARCGARASVRPGLPWVPQIREFGRRHRH
jgi:hypothetical protein